MHELEVNINGAMMLIGMVANIIPVPANQKQLFVQSEAEVRNFGEVPRVMHLAGSQFGGDFSRQTSFPGSLSPTRLINFFTVYTSPILGYVYN